MYWRNVTAWLQIERENTDGSSMGVSTILMWSQQDWSPQLVITTRSLFLRLTK